MALTSSFTNLFTFERLPKGVYAHATFDIIKIIYGKQWRGEDSAIEITRFNISRLNVCEAKISSIYYFFHP